jgi:hypothetical protein
VRASPPQCLGFSREGAEAGPAPEQVVDLTHERSGTWLIGEREVDTSQLDPGLDGEVGECVGQQRPQPLGIDEVPARCWDICPVQGYASLGRADKGGA